MNSRRWATEHGFTVPVYIENIFKAQAAKTGGIVRRKISAVERHSSESQLKKEVKKRGFHMVAAGDQYVIFCNSGRFDLIC